MAWYWYDLGPLGLLDTRIFTVDSGFDSVFLFGLDSFVFCCRYPSLVLLLRFFGSPDFQRSEALVGQTSVAPFFSYVYDRVSLMYLKKYGCPINDLSSRSTFINTSFYSPVDEMLCL
jgi:hypothetical protein